MDFNLGTASIFIVVAFIIRILATITKTENVFFYVLFFVFAFLSSINLMTFKDFINSNVTIRLVKIDNIVLPDFIESAYEYEIMGVT